MQELRDWLAEQSGGVRTFEEFQRRSYSIIQRQPENAAILKLLGNLSGKFAESYDDQPLYAAVAEEAFSRLLSLTDGAVFASSGDASVRLGLLNMVATAELDCTLQSD